MIDLFNVNFYWWWKHTLKGKYVHANSIQRPQEWVKIFSGVAFLSYCNLVFTKWLFKYEVKFRLSIDALDHLICNRFSRNVVWEKLFKKSGSRKVVDQKKRWFCNINSHFFRLEKSGWPEKKIRVWRTTFLEPLFYTFPEMRSQNKRSIAQLRLS